MSCEVKFIETSAGIQHNVDELLVGILKQMRLRAELDANGGSGVAGGTGDGAAGSKSLSRTPSRRSQSQRRVSSPLHTLQVARDILSRVCLKDGGPTPKSCENLHVL